jgi:uncharacterized protein (UPF0332 family)
MNMDKLFADKDYLACELHFFLAKKQIRTIAVNNELVQSHVKKARHNVAFYKLNKEHQQFNDWLIVVLYYAIYHAALALITKKQYASKNHYATILLLIQEYGISRDEADLLHELLLNKEDAALYTSLKDDRHKASYASQIQFDGMTVQEYESKVVDFINKTENMLHYAK